MPKKILYIARHAKSSWKDPSLSDFERPLNKRGRHDAPVMAEILKKRGVSPELILSSPARRARKTAEEYHEKLGGILRLEEGIYEASANTLLYMVQEALIDNKSVMIVGHNPALTELNDILSRSTICNIPTCGVVALEFEDGLEPGSGKELFFDYPKKHYG